jgi:hypothetical protein
MPTLSEVPHSMEPVEPELVAGKRAPLWYAALFVCVQLGALAGLLSVMARPWFLTHDGYPGIYQAGYGMRLMHADCDVVVYGDSSALTGLDPQLIAKITGLKTCNIAEARGVEDVVGFRFPLDAYLQRNKRPRFILMMLGAPSFLPDKKPFTAFSTEGMIYALQYDHGREMLHGFRRRPSWVVNFVFWAAENILENQWKQLLPWTRRADIDTRKQRADRDGIWPFPLPPEINCDYSALAPGAVVERNAVDVAETRKQYAVEGTQVIINVSPISNCNPYEGLYRKQLDGLHDNALIALPMPYFNMTDVHFSPVGSAYISTAAANQILELMHQYDAKRLNTPSPVLRGPIGK